MVVGVADGAQERLLRAVYAPLIEAGVPFLATDLPTAELVKVSANAFLATKVSFINAIAEVCDAAGADVTELATALGLDPRIGPEFLSAGIGYGGGCLPKDVRALIARADALGVGSAATFLRGVDVINMQRRSQMVALAIEECGGDVLGRQIAVLGAAFKPDTDDVRDSPALNIAAQLQLRGASVTVYDPQARATARAEFPTLRHADSALGALQDADLVLHLTEWPEFADIEPAEALRCVRRPTLIDGRNALDPQAWTAAGWRYRGFGRGAAGKPSGETSVRELAAVR